MQIYRLCYHDTFDTARSFFQFLTATDFSANDHILAVYKHKYDSV